MSTDSYSALRDISESFLSTVAQWIEKNEEVLVVLRYLRAAGAKDYALIRSSIEFLKLVDLCPVGTDIMVFRNRQLPMRGRVTDDLIAEASSELSTWNEYLYVVLNSRKKSDPRLFGEMGDTVETLIEDLSEYFSEEIAIGACPDFNTDDTEEMISRSKGGIDGPR